MRMEDILAVYFINHSTKRKTQEIKVRKKKEKRKKMAQ